MTHERLRAILGTEPPPGIAALDTAALDELADLVVAAQQRQARALALAFEDVLKSVPFPVRPIARRLLHE